MTEYEVWTAQRFTAATPVEAALKMRTFMTDHADQSEYIVYWRDANDNKHKFITDGGINEETSNNDGAGI
jgi:hypothetical protein